MRLKFVAPLFFVFLSACLQSSGGAASGPVAVHDNWAVFCYRLGCVVSASFGQTHQPYTLEIEANKFFPEIKLMSDGLQISDAQTASLKANGRNYRFTKLTDTTTSQVSFRPEWHMRQSVFASLIKSERGPQDRNMRISIDDQSFALSSAGLQDAYKDAYRRTYKGAEPSVQKLSGGEVRLGQENAPPPTAKPILLTPSVPSVAENRSVGANCSDAFFEGETSRIRSEAERVRSSGGLGAIARASEQLALAGIKLYSDGQTRCGRDFSSAIIQLQRVLSTARQQKQILGI